MIIKILIFFCLPIDFFKINKIWSMVYFPPQFYDSITSKASTPTLYLPILTTLALGKPVEEIFAALVDVKGWMLVLGR